MLIAALIFVAVVSAIQMVDVLKSVRGFAVGFEEGGWPARAIFGPKPKEWQLILLNTSLCFGAASPALFSHNVGLWGLGMGLLTGLGARHAQAIYEWHKVGI